jgi:flagellar hook-associated protein 2
MSTLRISGLASGMDIDSIVTNLMKAERMPLDKLKQKKQVLEWQRDDNRSMNTLLLNFRTELTNMKLTTKYRSRTTTSTNEAQVTATATSAASKASYSISGVTQLAAAASLTNGGKLSDVMNGKKVDLNKPLYANQTDFANNTTTDFEWRPGAVGSKTFAAVDGVNQTLPLDAGQSLQDITSMNVKVNGQTYTVTDTNTTPGANEVYIDVDGNMTFGTSIAANSNISVDYYTNGQAGQNYTTFSVTTYNSSGNPVIQNFGVQDTDTLNQVISKVNNSNAGVTMFYDSFTDQMTMTRKDTGDFNKSGNEIITSGNFINQVLKFDSTLGATESGGRDAIFTINGLTTQRHSNTFDMNGVTFTIKQEFSTNVDIAINNDTQTVFDNIKGFIDKYNELIDTINKKVTESYYRDYPPLTDDQKEQLSDKQQEQWTDKAKSGLLRGDSTLRAVLNSMRNNFYAPVNNSSVATAYNQLANIGIKTTANYLEGGKLEINEAKLKAAIEADPTSVENLFRGTGSTSSEQGIVQRLFDTVGSTMDRLKEKAGSSYSTNKQFALGRQLDSVSSQITSFEDRMKLVENRYYRQFTAMEQAIQKSNSQSTYLMQQFSGGQ